MSRLHVHNDVEGTDSPHPLEPDRSNGSGDDAAFDAAVNEIRTRLGTNATFLFPRLEDQVRQKLRVPPLTARSAGLAGITAICIRLGLALLATAIAGEWGEVPWARWLPILSFLTLMDVGIAMQHPSPAGPHRRSPGSADRRPRGTFLHHRTDDIAALLSTIERTSDVEQLADYTRRWYRLRRSASFGVVLAALILLASALMAPTAFDDLPAGSVVLLALLLYDLSETIVYSGNLVDVPLFSREASYDHTLFWPSPVDSPEVRGVMQILTIAPLWFGLVITIYLALAVVLVSWGSPLVVPLAVGLGAVGYLVTIYSTLRHRASIRRIVTRARDRHLERLQSEINQFRSRYTRLSSDESERLRGLIDLHNTIRDAPATPSTTFALSRAAAGLIVPTIMFVITIFGEVSAERILDAILP